MAEQDFPKHPFQSGPSPIDSPEKWALLTRELAGQGKLDEALASAGRWILADKLDPAAHYLRALIFREKGATAEAMHSLRRSLYLDPQFIVAHLALGKIERDLGHKQKAQKHLVNAMELLACQEAQTTVPECDGMTASQCLGFARALVAIEVQP